jgi:glycerol-1-phosphate dehydrogenase [NAD(P)+]
MEDFANLTLQELLRPSGFDCACGRHHQTGLQNFVLGNGVLSRLPEILQASNLRRPFVVSDSHTDPAAGERVRSLLDTAGIPYTSFIFPPQPHAVEPDEAAVGALCMAFDPACDALLAVGSGVINDCCKVAAHAMGRPSLVVATAPSMDGYASDRASMIQNRVKVSLYNACPTAIIADTSILCRAPEIMLKAGLGDMLAKYIALCEWRISHLVTGEYFCPQVAELVRRALARVREHAPGLLRREEAAIASVMEGLTLSGIAMSFAKISRPASGLEHYFSHLWEMKALRGLAQPSLHGIQVGVGTCLTLKLYEHIRLLKPSRAKAEAAIKAFSPAAWEEELPSLFGDAVARELIALEVRERKNDPAKHALRLSRLLEHWEDILQIIDEELPRLTEITDLMQGLGLPTTPEDIGLTRRDAVEAMLGSRSIRDKYLTSSMLWDLGELEDFTAYL